MKSVPLECRRRTPTVDRDLDSYSWLHLSHVHRMFVSYENDLKDYYRIAVGVEFSDNNG